MTELSTHDQLTQDLSNYTDYKITSVNYYEAGVHDRDRICLVFESIEDMFNFQDNFFYNIQTYGKFGVNLLLRLEI